jgi:hypothetical protein
MVTLIHCSIVLELIPTFSSKEKEIIENNYIELTLTFSPKKTPPIRRGL